MKKNLRKGQLDIKKELGKVAKMVSGNKYRASFPEYGNKEDENAAEMAEYEEHLALQKKLSQRLEETDEALKRIEENHYGVCESCNQLIDKARLGVNPAATLCINCKSQKERKG